MAASVLLGQFYPVGGLGQIIGLGAEDIGLGAEDIGLGAEDIGLGAEDIGLGAFEFDRFFIVAKIWGSALPGFQFYVLFVPVVLLKLPPTPNPYFERPATGLP
ncbi:MAG TPA: hypothetical protein PLB32_11215 [Acidobacteriota bacterium]|nr:hypothetical protein [Acidobacteriota bacterium]